MVLPDDFDARLRDLHTRGLSRNKIAAELGCSFDTVTQHAKKLGLPFDRRATAAAVAARSIDMKARRQAILDRLYKRAETNLTRIEGGRYSYRIVLGSSEFGPTSEIVADDAPPSVDERNHMLVITGYLTAAVKLEQVDASDNNGEVHAVLDTLADGFARAAAGYRPTAEDLDP